MSNPWHLCDRCLLRNQHTPGLQLKIGAVNDLAWRGAFVKVHPDGFKSGHLVQEAVGRACSTDEERKLEFIKESQGVQFPSPADRGGSQLSQDNIAAVAKTVQLGSRGVQWRLERRREICKIAGDLETMSNAVMAIAQQPEHIRKVSRQFNTAFQAALVDAIEWPDTDLPALLLNGFPVIGDIPGSRVFQTAGEDGRI